MVIIGTLKIFKKVHGNILGEWGIKVICGGVKDTTRITYSFQKSNPRWMKEKDLWKSTWEKCQSTILRMLAKMECYATH